MIPDPIAFLFIALKFIGRNWKWFCLGTLLLLVKCEHDGKLRWKAYGEKRDAQIKLTAAQLRETKAKFDKAALDQRVRFQAAQHRIDQETIHETRADRDALRARYGRLRVQFADASGRRIAASPEVRARPGGFAEDPQRPGFWIIRSEDALDILEAADGWRLSFDKLLGWADKRAAVTIDITPEPTAP